MVQALLKITSNLKKEDLDMTHCSSGAIKLYVPCIMPEGLNLAADAVLSLASSVYITGL